MQVSCVTTEPPSSVLFSCSLRKQICQFCNNILILCYLARSVILIWPPLWSRGNIVTSYSAEPGSIPVGSVSWLSFSPGFSLNRKAALTHTGFLPAPVTAPTPALACGFHTHWHCRNRRTVCFFQRRINRSYLLGLMYIRGRCRRLGASTFNSVVYGRKFLHCFRKT